MALLPHVIEKLKASEARYEQLMALVSDQAVQSDGNAYRKYSKELSDVQPLVEAFNAYERLGVRSRQRYGCGSAPGRRRGPP